MKINKFFLFFLIIFTNNISNSFANEDVVQKGLEIFNGKGQCAVCHILKDAGSQGSSAEKKENELVESNFNNNQQQ